MSNLIENLISRKKTNAEKKEMWRQIQDNIVIKWGQVYESVSTKESQNLVMALKDLETKGGACPKCSTNWLKVEKENQFMFIVYYNPQCYCFIKCPLCGRSLHYEYFSRDLILGKCYKPQSKGKVYRNYCYCGHQLIDQDSGEYFHGLSYEIDNVNYLNNLRKQKDILYETPSGELIKER